MTKAYLLQALCEKMTSPDQDLRFMALNDLMNEISRDPSTFQGDESVELKTLEHVMKLIEDTISEVKNIAVQCLGQLSKILRDSHQDYVMDKLIGFFSGQEDELRDVAGAALKTVAQTIPDKIIPKACAKLGPRLLKQLQNPGTPPEAILEGLAILSILNSRSPDDIAKLDPQPVVVFTQLLKHPRAAVRKRAITTIANFVPTSSDSVFTSVQRDWISPSWGPSVPVERKVTTVQLVATIARQSPQKLGPILPEVLNGMFEAVSKDDPELKEGCLQAMETLVLRCPTEVTSSLSKIVATALEYIKYDPNYAGDDGDEDEEMGDGDDDDDEGEGGDEYSDDEDTSYKTRRSATKVLAAVIGTRPELLSKVYQNVSPVLISRFGDREESVKIEVWATYVVLLSQTGVYGRGPDSRDLEVSTGSKRKREDESMEVEDAPVVLLRTQVAALSKALLKQLQPKSSAASLQAGFQLFIELLTVLPGSLANQASPVLTTSKEILALPVTTNTAALHTTVLTFLVLFFSAHPPASFGASSSAITPTILNAVTQKHPRIAAEAFKVFSALLQALKPLHADKGGDWALQVYKEANNRLGRNDTDAEVRAAAEVVVGDLWICATPVVSAHPGNEWDSLRKSGRPEGAVQAVTRVAAAKIPMGTAWSTQSIEWVLAVIRKSGRGGRVEAFRCLDVLISSGEVSSDLVRNIIQQLKQYLVITDITVLSEALLTLSGLLKYYPKVSYPLVENQVLPATYQLACSPLVTGPALDSILQFFGTLVEADGQIATHVIPGLIKNMDELGSEASPSNVSKCLAKIVRVQMGIAAGTIAEFTKYIKPGTKAKELRIVLSLLTIGEIGRFVDMSTQTNVFDDALRFFAADAESIRSSAAFAAGNIAIGNLHVFLPVIVSIVQKDAGKRLLALHALKEVVSNCSHAQLEGVADTIWVPLFGRSEGADEATRNVAAACLGKVTATNPSRYLVQLRGRLNDRSPAVRATVLSAIRYTFADTDSQYDELLSPLIVDFLTLMLDTDLTVRRLSLSTLNAAARNKPHLVQEHLSRLLPLLYAETILKPELIRIVEMGPWKHRVDDGLEARKTAYETMYTLLETCLGKIDLNEFLNQVLRGIGDDANDVKVLGYMMLFRLAQVAPTVMAQRLDEAVPELEKTMKDVAVTKDTVKQDLERAAELQRSCLRAIAGLSKIRASGNATAFDAFVSKLEQGKWASEFKELRSSA